MSGSGGQLSNAQLFQQMALMRWLSSQSDRDREALAALTGIQVAKELLDRITGQSSIDAYKRECIQGIADFVQKNPKASQTQINAELEKQVVLFAARVKLMESAPIL